MLGGEQHDGLLQEGKELLGGHNEETEGKFCCCGWEWMRLNFLQILMSKIIDFQPLCLEPTFADQQHASMNQSPWALLELMSGNRPHKGGKSRWTVS